MTAQKRPNIPQMTNSHTNNTTLPLPPSEPPCITTCMCSRSRDVILKHTYVRLKLMPCILVTRIRLLPHKPRLSPNALALLHLTTTTTRQTYIRFPRQPTTQLAHSKTPRNVQETVVYTQSPASFNTHLSTVLTSHHQQEHSAAKKRLISSRH